MQKDARSVATKNLVGGFLGGACGILTCGYFYTFLMPLGVLVGVVAGWWYEAIWNMIVKNVHDGIELVDDYIRRSRAFIDECAQFSMKSLFQRKKKEGYLQLSWFSFIETIFIWFFTRPIACWKWFNRHPMNRAYALKALLIVLEFTCIVAITAFLVHYFMPENLGGGIGFDGRLIPAKAPRLTDYVFGTILFSFFSLLIPFVCFMNMFDDYTAKDFYIDFSDYASLGPVKYFFHFMFKAFIMQAKIAILALLSIVYFSGMVIMFVGIFVAPLAIIIWTVKGVNEIIMRRGHWLCLGVTMTVTTLVVYFLNPYFGNISILWATALGAGMASGGLTEGLRRTIAWVFENTSIGRQYANAKCWEFLKDRLIPRWGVVSNVWEKNIVKNLL